MKSFVRSWVIAALAAFALVEACTPSFAGIVYTMSNEPDVQNGWALSGTITVSRTGNDLTRDDITGWAYTVSKERDSYTYSSTDLGSSSQTTKLLATDTQLILPYAEQFSFFGSNLGFRTQFGATTLTWESNFGGNTYGASDYYNGNNLSFWSTNNFPFATNEGLVIGTVSSSASSSAVPEIDPATGASALSLVAGVLAMVEQRRRRGLKAVLAG